MAAPPYNVSNNMSDKQRFGWVDSPNGRGTLDITWTCVSALFLCLWSMLHLNLPASRDTIRTKFFRKWSLQHAFYADSGGFLLQQAHSEPFPVTAKQIKYLIQCEYVPVPSITRKEIRDKSKADEFLKGFTFFQTGWLVTQTISRAIQHLTVTPLELSTIAMACTSLATLGFWWHKPLDVETPTVLYTDRTTTEILQGAGEAGKESWQDTPLDFIEEKTYMSSKWNKTVLHWIISAGLQTRPLSRIPNDRDPQASNTYEHVLLAITTATFASVHFLGWNYEFATGWERWLWRGSCLAIWGLLAVYGTTEVVICYREGYAYMGLESALAYKMRWPLCLWFFIPATLYSIARVCLLIEAIICMRSLPAAAFDDVQWSALLPHL